MYKLIDGKGRVLIPKELRVAASMDYGDIVRLGIANGKVSVLKVDIIEVGDQSPEAVEAYVRAAFKTMPDDTRLSLIAELTELLKQKKEV
jgi:bifunctional DNA-binding transcriptional regulator/antitoxin component of YhaV-PrlF toxin-antitoxin module